ncbi:MAG: HAD family hydrolase, partial [Actinobacteria bacterium]|nr:HAD family hydrolase [Actinomycetota bacterium]NIS34483.1 HAD family hydrolase [Actinomycetota bacterium]NIT97522.1 HAD family hydrolase [Actinomycetota bacterium]NIU21187.1 HAD family hydrolase [Actinomycetota bacterium]NIU69253.1 HAD family hydrolase [Actinomycetota bacterium]
APHRPEEIRGRGNVREVLDGLRRHGVRIAVATTDDRHLTETALDALAIRELVPLMSCGDDPGPRKPSPRVLETLSTR